MNESTQDGPGPDAVYSWPMSSANWRAARSGEPIQGSTEYPIYTDSWITGEIGDGLGPYRFINAIAIRETHESHLYPAIILRLDWHLPEGALKPDLSKSGFDNYHGGWIEDELAALIGLQLGIRARAGGPSRRFDLDDDPKGRLPQAHTRRSHRFHFQDCKGESYHGHLVPTT